MKTVRRALAALALACLAPGCAFSIAGDAKSNCYRVVDAIDDAIVRCHFPTEHAVPECSAVMYSDTTSDEVDACVHYLQDTACRELQTTKSVCGAHFTEL